MQRRFIVGLTVVAMVVAAACSKKASTPAASPASQESAATSAAASTVAVELQEFAVIATPSSVPAGSVTFNTTNSGPDDVHEVVIIKTDLAIADIPTDKDGAMIEDAAGLDPIDEIEDLEVGDTQDLTVDLEPGSYLLVCNIVQTEPDGSLEAHFKMGMSTEFTVTGSSSASQDSAGTSSGAAAYTATEFSFDGPDTLPAGTSDITVENVGSVDHEMIIIRLDKHQDWTEEQVVEYVKNDPQKQPKWAVPVGGLYVSNGPPTIAPGETAPVVFMDFSSGKPTIIKDGSLEPGTYLFMCFVGGKAPHAAMGMVKKVTVA